METLELNRVVYSDKGTKINYEYVVSNNVQKYFTNDEFLYSKYQVDVSNIPYSIAVIPFLSNIMPIAWFVGFDVKIEEVDKVFLESLEALKQEFDKHHPDKELKGSLQVKKVVNNTIDGDKNGLLFSGGLDSFESYTRNYDLDPILVSIHGADVAIDDTIRWNDFVRFNEEEQIVKNENLFYIESNLRDFYTYQLELLVDIGWWGKIQHGMALIGAIAPLGYHKGISKIFIGSSNTEEISFGWGSSPEIDEKMKWANSAVVHDGYHLRRTDKIENIVAYCKENNTSINLRVCYSEKRDGYNCNVCAKCQRTILGLILSGANPNDFGFMTPSNLYELVLNNFNENNSMTEGLKHEWKCLQEKATAVDDFFVLEDKEQESKKINTFINLNLSQMINKHSEKVKKQQKARFIIRNKFPWLVNLYKKIK